MIIDATSETEWVYLELDQLNELRQDAMNSEGQEEFVLSQSTLETTESDDWDIAFQRFKIKSNGGISGDAGVEIAILKDTLYEDISVAPNDMYLVDQMDSDDQDVVPDYVFNLDDQWYEYEFSSHTLSTRNYVYVIHTTDDHYFKFMIEDYYDNAGNSGYVTCTIQQINPPEIN